MNEKIILFGGSFDPVHLGHIEILRFVHNYLRADKSILIPARRSPLKQSSPVATDVQRLDMLNLAITEYNDFEVSDIEFNLPEPSFSYNTISYFYDSYCSKARLYWLVGADVLSELNRWYRINDILKMCDIVIASRGGCERCDLSEIKDKFDPEIAHRIKENILDTPKIEISSTQIRKALKQGKSVDNMLNDQVAQYIRMNEVY